MKNKFNSEQLALVKLIDEPDEHNFKLIAKKIIEYGKEILPLLKEALLTSIEEIEIKRLNLLISEIEVNILKQEFKVWAQVGHSNLFYGLFLINTYKYPDVEFKDIKSKIADIEHDIWLELNERLTILEKIRVFNKVFFDIYGFRPNKQDYHSPSNSFIWDVLRTKLGDNMSLASLYIILAQNLNLPVYGVNLPENFICTVINEGDNALSFVKKGEPLFYINPLNNGSTFTRPQIENFISKLKLEPKDEYFYPCSNIDIIIRILNNLSNSYQLLKETKKHRDIEMLKDILLNQQK